VFITFGYNEAPPAQPDPVPATPAPPAAAPVNAGAEPDPAPATDPVAATDPAVAPTTNATSTASEVTVPTSLTAESASGSEGGVISLTWKKSETSGITGYNVYRSTEEKAGFIKIGSVGKTELSYKDEEAIDDTEYFYKVRAVKDKTESKDSNTANATLTDTSAPTAPKSFRISSQNENEIVFTWDKGIETDLANYVLSVNSLDKQGLVIIGTIAKDATTYTLKMSDDVALKKDELYAFDLQAKDISNNISEKSTVKGKFEKKIIDTTSIPWLWIAIGGGALILIIIIVLTIVITHNRKKAKLAKTASAPNPEPNPTPEVKPKAVEPSQEPEKK
jgi:hypothetical protein